MKISPGTAPARATTALAVGLMAIPAVMAAGHPLATHKLHAARAPRQPGLTISVDDGHAAARTGDLLTYTVTVHDTGTVASGHLKVTQSMSAGLTLLSASDHGVAKDGRVTWSATVPVGGTRTFHVATRVTKTPPTLLRLAAVACIELAGSSNPVVCAAHLDRLPAAAEAAAPSSESVQPAQSARPARSGGGVLTYTGAGLAVLVLGLLAALAARRRRWRAR